MGMEGYLDYLQNMAETPNETYRNMQQAWVDAQWDNTTLLAVVDEETAVGTNIFNSVEVWKNTVSEFSVNVIKDAKDFRRLMFQNQDHVVTRGLKYQFNNNMWLVYEETNVEEPYCDILVRRCNNVAKWIDIDTGAILQEPCILDYTLSATNPKKDKDVIVEGGSVTLIIQGNENTFKLNPNQRFIFNKVPYKFVAYNNYMQIDSTTNEVPLLFLDCNLDMIQPSDDLTNNIANATEYQYSIEILSDNLQQVNGFSGDLNAQVLLNGEIVDRPVTWSSNDYATVDQNGTYTLNGAVGDIATITANITGNINANSTIQIEIVSAVVDSYELIIDPLYDFVKQNRVNTFTVTLYKNGEPQADNITYTTSGLDSSYFTLTQNGNQFTLVGLKASTTPLVINFTSGTTTKSISILLKSAF